MADFERGLRNSRFEFSKNNKQSFENFQFEFSTKTPIFFQFPKLKSASYYSLTIQASFWTKIIFINGFKRQLFSIE